jgi:multicomponent K+:H+ antiporter subunit E
MMRQLIPSPWMSGALIIFWLLLNESISVGHIVLAVAAGLVGGWTLSLLDLPKPHLQRPGAILRLAGRVFVDIVRSNVAVAGIILGFGRSGRASGFVDIPIRLRDAYALAALACIITSTPGTLWVGFDEARGTLTIHVLDLTDESEWIDTIKDRYERLLLEIFA